MPSESNLPVSKMLDFLLELEQAPDLDTFYSRIVTGYTRLIPAEASVDCMAGVPAPSRCLASTDVWNEKHKFNEYFRDLVPFRPDIITSLRQTDYREWENCEYVTDFVRACHIWRSMASPSLRISVVLHRTRREKPFTDREIALHLALAPHIEALHENQILIARLGFEQVREFELRVAHLTRREVAILRLAHRRFTSTEIGWQLGISPRTVEKHFANMYEKTGTSSRWELLQYFAEAQPVLGLRSTTYR